MAGESIRNPSEDYLIQAMDTYDWLGSVSVGDLHAVQQTESVGWPELLNIIAERLMLIEKLDTGYLQIGNKIAFNAHEKAVLERLSLYSAGALAGIRMTFADLVEIEAAGCLTDQLFHERILQGEDINPDDLTPGENPGAKLNAPASPQNPAGIMYTLIDLYNRLNEGAAVTRATAFVGPSAGPGPVGYDLNEIMGAAPAKDELSGATPADVALGKAFWGLRSDGWGVMVGSAGTPDDDGFTALDVVMYDWLAGFTMEEVKDAYQRTTASSVAEFLAEADQWIQKVRTIDTPLLNIPTRLYYNPDEKDLIQLLSKYEQTALSGIVMSFSQLVTLQGNQYLTEEVMNNTVLKGVIIDTTFVEDPVAYINGHKSGFVPEQPSYTDLETDVIKTIALLKATGSIDLEQTDFDTLLTDAENQGFADISLEDLVLFHAGYIILESDTRVYNPKFVSSVQLSVSTDNYKLMDTMKIVVQDPLGSPVETLYDGIADKENMVARWNVRKNQDGQYLEDGAYRFVLTVYKQGTSPELKLERTMVWGTPDAVAHATAQYASGPALAAADSMNFPESDLVNVAQGKTATQSSTYNSDGVAGHAVDGNTDGNYGNRSVTHTQADNTSWWQVDLGINYNIETVVIWNRTDGGGENLSNFYVLVSDEPFVSNTLSEIQAQEGVSAYHFDAAGESTIVSVNRTGRYVRVQLAGVNYLHMAEVQVWANPDIGVLNVSSDFVGDQANGEKATSSSTMDYYNDILYGKILKFDIVDGSPEVYFYNGVDKYQRSTSAESGVRTSVDLNLTIYLPTLLYLYFNEWNGFCVEDLDPFGWGWDCANSKLFRVNQDGSLSEIMRIMDDGDTGVYDAAPDKYVFRGYNNAQFGGYRIRVRADYLAPTVQKATGEDLAIITDESPEMFGALFEAIKDQKTNQIQIGNYLYSYEPPLTDAHGEGSLVLKKEDSTNGEETQYMRLEGTFESGDIHMKLDDEDVLWLCWLKPSDTGDPNRRVPKIMKVEGEWTNEDPAFLLEWAGIYKIDMSGYLAENPNLTQEDINTLEALKELVTWKYDCYTPVLYEKILYYYKTRDYDLETSYKLAFMEANGSRFWIEGILLSDGPGLILRYILKDLPGRITADFEADKDRFWTNGNTYESIFGTWNGQLEMVDDGDPEGRLPASMDAVKARILANYNTNPLVYSDHSAGTSISIRSVIGTDALNSLLSAMMDTILGDLVSRIAVGYTSIPLDFWTDVNGTLTFEQATLESYLRAILVEYPTKPLRFYGYKDTFASASQALTAFVFEEAALKIINQQGTDEAGSDNFFKALEYAVMFGSGENPLTEPDVLKNNFNSANGLKLSETDLEIKYMEEPIFKVVRNYDSGGARFRSSFIGVNREKEMLVNFFSERKVENLFALQYKTPVNGFGSGWNFNLDGTLLVNYSSTFPGSPDREYTFTDKDDRERYGIQGNLLFSLNGSIVSFSFKHMATEPDWKVSLDVPVSLDDFTPQNKNAGFAVRIGNRSNPGSPASYDDPTNWTVELLDRNGVRYIFEESAVSYDSAFNCKTFILDNPSEHHWSLGTARIAYKLSEVIFPNSLKFQYHYTPLSPYHTGKQAYTTGLSNGFENFVKNAAISLIKFGPKEDKTQKTTDEPTGDPDEPAGDSNEPAGDSAEPTENSDEPTFEEKLKANAEHQISQILTGQKSVEDAAKAYFVAQGYLLLEKALDCFPPVGQIYRCVKFLFDISTTVKTIQDYELDYLMPRLYKLEILKDGETLNELTFLYRVPNSDFTLPDQYKALQISKILCDGMNGESTEVWYRYNESDLLSSVEVNREERASYQYDQYYSESLGLSHLLSKIHYQNGATKNFQYAPYEMTKEDFYGATDDERKNFAQFLLTGTVENDIKNTSYVHSNIFSYVPYNDSKNYSRSFYFKNVSTVLPDLTNIKDTYDSGMLEKREMPELSYSETMENDLVEMLTTQKTINDNGQETAYVFDDFYYGEAGTVKVTDKSDERTEKTENVKASQASSALTEENMIALSGTENMLFPFPELNQWNSKNIANTYFQENGQDGYTGALKENVVTKDLSDRNSSLLTGDFLTSNNQNTHTYTYDEYGRVTKGVSDLLEIDYTYEITTGDSGAKYITRSATTRVFYKDFTQADPQADPPAEPPKMQISEYTSSQTYDLATGRIVTEKDANGLVTQYEYEDDRLTEKSYPDGTSETWDYDIKNRTVTQTDRNGITKVSNLDQDGNLIFEDFKSELLADTQNGYDVNGNLISKKIALGETEFFSETSMYDHFGRLTEMANCRDESVVNQYLANNKALSTINNQRKISTQTNSFKGVKAIEIQDMDGLTQRTVNVTTGKYHHPEEVVFSKGNLDRVMKNEADGTQILNQTDEGLQKLAISGTGFIQKRRALNGTVHEDLLFIMDGLGRPLNISQKDGTSWNTLHKLRYDEDANADDPLQSKFGNSLNYQNGKLTTAKTEHTTNRYIYNQNGKITEEQLDYDGKEFFINYKWKTGRVDFLESLEFKNGKTISYHYDSAGRLTCISFPVNGENKEFQFSYQPDNRLDTVSYPNEVTVERIYESDTGQDEPRYLRKINIKKGETDIRRIDYTQEKKMITVREDHIFWPESGVAVYTSKEEYARDLEDNLIGVVRTDSMENKFEDKFVYDNSYSIISHSFGTEGSISACEIQYNYVDSSNRLLNMQDNPSFSPSGIQPVSVNFDETTKRPSSIKTGSMTLNLGYDVFNNIIFEEGRQYTVDYKGRRVCKKENTKSRYYIYNISNNLIAEAQTNGTFEIVYIWGPKNSLLAKVKLSDSGESIEYYSNDHLGSNIVCTSELGEIQSHNQYSVWGVPNRIYSKQAYDEQDFIFTGKFFDNQSCSYNLGARSYYPYLKRFLNDDPASPNIKNLKTHNSYLYVQNDPVGFIDPDGRQRLFFALDASVSSGLFVSGLTSGTALVFEGLYATPVLHGGGGVNLTAPTGAAALQFQILVASSFNNLLEGATESNGGSCGIFNIDAISNTTDNLRGLGFGFNTPGGPEIHSWTEAGKVVGPTINYGNMGIRSLANAVLNKKQFLADLGLFVGATKQMNTIANRAMYEHMNGRSPEP